MTLARFEICCILATSIHENTFAVIEQVLLYDTKYMRHKNLCNKSKFKKSLRSCSGPYRPNKIPVFVFTFARSNWLMQKATSNWIYIELSFGE